MSCSYGPGRYDPSYEQQGHDYPIGLCVDRASQLPGCASRHGHRGVAYRALISHRFEIEQAAAAYELLAALSPP